MRICSCNQNIFVCSKLMSINETEYLINFTEKPEKITWPSIITSTEINWNNLKLGTSIYWECIKWQIVLAIKSRFLQLSKPPINKLCSEIIFIPKDYSK